MLLYYFLNKMTCENLFVIKRALGETQKIKYLIPYIGVI